jgi:hypothetical protein
MPLMAVLLCKMWLESCKEFGIIREQLNFDLTALVSHKRESSQNHVQIPLFRTSRPLISTCWRAIFTSWISLPWCMWH